MTTRNFLYAWLVRTLQRAAWAPLLLLISHAVASLGFNAYRLFPPLDMPAHFLGGVAATFFLREAARNAEEFVGGIPPTVKPLLLFSGFSSIAIFWEFLEFLSDRFLGTMLQSGLSDTFCDLSFGMLGSLTYLAACGKMRLIPYAGKVAQQRKL